MTEKQPMKQMYPVASFGMGVFLGSVATFLMTHEPTKKKIKMCVKQTKRYVEDIKEKMGNMIKEGKKE